MRGPILRLLSGAFVLNLTARNLTGNISLGIGSAPTGGQALRANATDPTLLEWYTPATGNGTVTSVGLVAPSIFSVSNSPVTGSGDLTLTLVNQAANTVFAAPNGAAGAPTFRALVANDIPNLDAAKITTGTIGIARLPVGTAANTVAAGNDSRFHTQNTDTGTTQQSFQLQSGSSGARIKNNAGALEVRNAADNAFADLVCQNLTVQGTQTIINSNTVNIGDNILTLNSDYVGSSPTENAGLEINRGSLTAGSFIWDESADDWKAGLAGSELRLARIFRQSFTAASLASNILTVTHNLGNQRVLWQVYDNADNDITPPSVATSTNIITFDFTGVTISGTWNVVVMG